ncbi:MAG: hypothetical protein AAF264_00245 [Pseudomonadota bacterium]
MFETHTSRTYDAVFARARAERAAVFRGLFTLRLPSLVEILSRPSQTN